MRPEIRSPPRGYLEHCLDGALKGGEAGHRYALRGTKLWRVHGKAQFLSIREGAISILRCHEGSINLGQPRKANIARRSAYHGGVNYELNQRGRCFDLIAWRSGSKPLGTCEVSTPRTFP